MTTTLQLDADDAEPHLEEKEGQDEYSQLQMPVWPGGSLTIGRSTSFIDQRRLGDASDIMFL